MSIHVMNWVWKHSHHKGSGLLLLLAIADHAHDDGDGAYPSVQTLASKIRMSERQTQRLINSLVESKELEIDKNAGPHRCHLYRVTFCQGDTSALEGGDIIVSPKPSIEPSVPSGPSDSNESSVPTGVVPIKRRTSITVDFINAMVLQYPELDVHEEIKKAVAHKGYTTYDGKQKYVEDWLKRAIKFQAETTTDIKAKPKKSKVITEDFRQRMREKHANDPIAVDDEIDRAMNHTAVKKAIDVEKYVQNWLNNQVKWGWLAQGKGGNATKSQAAIPAGDGPSAGELAFYERARARGESVPNLPGE